MREVRDSDEEDSDGDKSEESAVWLKIVLVGVAVIIIIILVCALCRMKSANDARTYATQTQHITMAEMKEQQRAKRKLSDSSELVVLEERRDSLYVNEAQRQTNGGGVDDDVGDDEMYAEHAPTAGDGYEGAQRDSVYEHGVAGVEVTVGHRANEKDDGFLIEQQSTTKGDGDV